MEETLLITRFSNTKETCKWLFTIRFKSGFTRKFTKYYDLQNVTAIILFWRFCNSVSRFSNFKVKSRYTFAMKEMHSERQSVHNMH